MEEKTNKNLKWAVIIDICFVWMTTMFGGGWATGMNSYVYGAQAGFAGILAALGGLLAIGVVCWITIEFARLADVSNYRTFMDAIYRTKIAGIIYDVIQLVCVPISIGACVSTFASCLTQNFGFNYWLGVAIFSVIVLASTMWGNEVLGKLGSFMGSAIIVLLVVCFGLIVSKRSDAVAELVTTKAVITSWGDAAYWGIVRFWMLSGGMALSILPIFKPIRNRVDTTKCCILSYVLCAFFVVTIGVVVITGLPEGASSSVPYLYALQQLGLEIVNVMYVAVVCLAVITTGNTILFAYQARYCDLAFVKKLQAKESTKMLVIGIILIGLSCAISAFGMYNIIAKGYGMMSFMTTPLVSFGIPIVGTFWLIFAKKHGLKEHGALAKYWAEKKANK